MKLVELYPWSVRSRGGEGHFFDTRRKRAIRMMSDDADDGGSNRFDDENNKNEYDNSNNNSSWTKLLPTYDEMVRDPELTCRWRSLYFAAMFNSTRIRETAARAAKKAAAAAFPASASATRANDKDDDKDNSQLLLVYEKTPAYIRVPGVAAIMHRMFGVLVDNDDDANRGANNNNNNELKLVAVLRNPIDRLYSEFKYVIARTHIWTNAALPRDFDFILEQDLHALRRVNLTAASTPTLKEYQQLTTRTSEQVSSVDDDKLAEIFRLISGRTHDHDVRSVERLIRWNPLPKNRMSINFVYNSMYAVHLADWLPFFQLNRNLLVLNFDDLQRDLKGSLRRIFEFTGRNTELTNQFVDGLPDEILNQHYSLETTWNYTEYPERMLTNATREYLQRFFEPYNNQLADLLGEDWPRQWK